MDPSAHPPVEPRRSAEAPSGQCSNIVPHAPICAHLRPIRVSEAPQIAPKSAKPQIGNGTKRNGMEHFFAWAPWFTPLTAAPKAPSPGGARRRRLSGSRPRLPLTPARPPVPPSDAGCHDPPTPHRRRALRVRGRAGKLRLCPPLAVVEYGCRRPRMVRGLVLQEGNQGGDCDG